VRRTLFGLLVLAAALTVLPSLSCQRENALRIVDIDDPFYSDLIDYGVERDLEGDPYEVELTPTDSCIVRLQYVEIGPGLPTWTPYQAHIEKVKVTLKQIPGLGDPIEGLPPFEVPFKTVVVADPTGEGYTEASFELLSAWYKDEYFSDGDLVILEATITISGYDDASGKRLTATNKMELSVADWWDDPQRIGQ